MLEAGKLYHYGKGIFASAFFLVIYDIFDDGAEKLVLGCRIGRFVNIENGMDLRRNDAEIRIENRLAARLFGNYVLL